MGKMYHQVCHMLQWPMRLVTILAHRSVQLVSAIIIIIIIITNRLPLLGDLIAIAVINIIISQVIGSEVSVSYTVDSCRPYHLLVRVVRQLSQRTLQNTMTYCLCHTNYFTSLCAQGNLQLPNFNNSHPLIH